VAGRRGGDRDRLLPRDRIGIQLFTVRDQVAPLGFEAVFARLSEIGYREVEFAGYNAQDRRCSNSELRTLLQRIG
jgi:sugar phosphate isomerase/epimerase